MLWSIGNELSARPGPVQQFYIERAVRQAKALDPSRPVGLRGRRLPVGGLPAAVRAARRHRHQRVLRLVPGPNGQIADRDALPDYLDSVRACYPDKAIFVSEFGAEANRDGPGRGEGHLRVPAGLHQLPPRASTARKPWLSGSLYWALQEFRVRPNWDGGNPRPNPPVHEKGLLRFDGSKKPAWFDVAAPVRRDRPARPGAA